VVVRGELNAEARVLSRRLGLLCVLLGALVLGWLAWRGHSSTAQNKVLPAPIIVKEPVNFARRTFDPANPPAEMPSLPAGENAECDSNFISNASVAGQPERIDATHATVTITQIKVTLQLNITIWVPEGVSQHVMDHEIGHREISESYYETADQLAGRIASTYVGKQAVVTGNDLDAEINKSLQQIGGEITEEFDKELNPNPTQLLYDSITDHSRNEVVAADAVAHALKNGSIEAPQPSGTDPLANP
jgi:hypothetical protein